MYKLKIIILIFVIIHTINSFSIQSQNVIPNINTDKDNISITHDPINNATLSLWSDINNKLWITYINYNNNNNNIISRDLNIKGKYPIISFDPFSLPNVNQITPIIMSYLTTNENNLYNINIQISNDGGYNWQLVYTTPIIFSVNNKIKLSLSIGDLSIVNNDPRYWLLCYENITKFGCLSSFNLTNWNKVDIEIPSNKCNNINIAGVQPSNWNLMTYCSDDNINYVQRNYNINTLTFTDPPQTTVSLLPSIVNIDNNIHNTLNNNIFLYTMTNKLILASSLGIATTQVGLEFTSYIFTSENDVRYILDLKDNSNWIYAQYLSTTKNISIYKSNDDLNSLQYLYSNNIQLEDNQELVDISITSNYIDKIYINLIISNTNNINIEIWNIDILDLVTNDIAVDFVPILLPSIEERDNFKYDSITYGNLIINDTLTVDIHVTLQINGDLIFDNNTNTYINENSTINISNTAIFDGNLLLPSYNKSKSGDIIVVISYKDRQGMFDNITFSNNNCIDNSKPITEYTRSALQVVMVPCDNDNELKEISLIVYIVLVSCIVLFIVFLVIGYTKYKDQIFSYRKRAKESIFYGTNINNDEESDDNYRISGIDDKYL